MRIAVSNETMRHSDRMTIDTGVPSLELMKRAGKGIYDAALGRWGKKCAVVCGGGNNGGDGFVIALCMKKDGLCPHILLVGEKFSADGAYYFEECKKSGIPFSLFCESFDFSCFDSIADCIFGTGFSGELSGIEKACVEKINESGKFVVSADINSGMSGNGSFSGLAVSSDLTVAIGFYKSGHFLGVAKDRIKELACVDIGIKLYGASFGVPDILDMSKVFSERLNNSHKGSYGYCAIIGGCLEYSGAAKLANIAACAMRSGCGVVKLAVARSISAAVSSYLLESTLFPIDDVAGHMLFDEKVFSALIKGTAAVSCGMGWGTHEENEKILTFLLKNYEGRLIVDADGLNTLSRLDFGIVAQRVCKKIVLTPHPLEFSRISGFSMDEIFSNPIKCVEEYTSRLGEGAVVLLKGASTVVCDEKETYIVDRGCPGMATAGSGDVLSGILTGLFGYTEPCAKSVACGAFIAGLAGELAQEETGAVSMIASDTVRYIPEAIKRICAGS